MTHIYSVFKRLSRSVPEDQVSESKQYSAFSISKLICLILSSITLPKYVDVSNFDILSFNDFNFN